MYTYTHVQYLLRTEIEYEGTSVHAFIRKLFYYRSCSCSCMYFRTKVRKYFRTFVLSKVSYLFSYFHQWYFHSDVYIVVPSFVRKYLIRRYFSLSSASFKRSRPCVRAWSRIWICSKHSFESINRLSMAFSFSTPLTLVRLTADRCAFFFCAERNQPNSHRPSSLVLKEEIV